MIRKLLTCASLAGLLLLAGTAARAQPIRTQSDSGKRSQQATKTVSGKVTSIGNSAHRFLCKWMGATKK